MVLKPRVKVQPSGLQVQYVSTPHSAQLNPLAQVGQALPLNMVHALPGIPIPLGQTLIITAGCGWVQSWGKPIEEVKPGDVIQFEPDEKHWHGATHTTAMTHIAVQEYLNSSPVEWLEYVSDEQYKGESRT